MTPVLSSWEAVLTLVLYAAAMIGAVALSTRRDGRETKDHFLVADRRLKVFPNAASLAVSWIWAPAIFFCSLKAYTQGLAGVFWFTVPNVLCFLIFVPVARAMRRQEQVPYSMPDFLRNRFSGNGPAHISAVVACMGIDIVALLFNAFIGAFLLNVLAGIPTWVGILAMMTVALAYSAWRGLRASVVTDVIQLLTIIVIALLIVPWTVAKAGGIVAITSALGGASGNFGSVLNFEVFYSFGILATINLLSVPLVDQMFYQRAFACPERNLMKTFLLAGALFAVVPIVLSLLGFIAVHSPVHEVVDQPGFPTILVGVAAVQQYLPAWTLVGFAIIAICALSSTIDSALCAISSLWAHDIYHKYLRPQADDDSVLRAARNAVIMSGLIVAIVAVAFRNHLNGDMFFNFNGVLASAVVPPLLLSLAWRRTAGIGVAAGIVVAALAYEPLMLWSSYHVYMLGDPSKASAMVVAAVGAPLTSLVITVVASLILEKRNPDEKGALRAR